MKVRSIVDGRSRSQRQRIVGALALVVVGGCASPDHNAEYRARLAGVGESRAEGRLAEASRAAQALIVETAGDARGEYALQRFYAHALLAEIHCDAAMRDPFLPGVRGGKGEREVLESAHLIAAMPQIEHCKDLLASAGGGWPGPSGGGPPVVDGEELIPAALYGAVGERVGPAAISDRLTARELAILARLGFTHRFSERVRSGALGTAWEPDAVEGVMARLADGLHLTRPERIWIAYGLHDFATTIDDEAGATAAFRYARIGYQLSLEGSTVSEEAKVARTMRDWVADNGKWEFRHNDFRGRLEPSELVTLQGEGPEGGTPRYIDFVAVRRSNGS